jgi:hypothetical protein
MALADAVREDWPATESLANKISITQYVEDRFSPGFGSDAEFYLSFLNDKQGISCIPLSINGLSLPE